MHPRLFRRVDTRPVNNDWGRRDSYILVGADGNAPRALASLPSGTVLQTAVVGNTQNLLLNLNPGFNEISYRATSTIRL